MADFTPDPQIVAMCQGKRIYVDGAFDLVHWGHLNALRQANQLGGELVVGINSDSEIQAAKGILPIYDQYERAELIKGCKWTNEVMIGTPYDVNLDFLLNEAKCDFIAHGDDIAIGASGKDTYEEPKNAGKFIAFKRSLGVSTSTTLGRLIDALESEHFRHITTKKYVLEGSEFEKSLRQNEEEMINEGLSDDVLSCGVPGLALSSSREVSPRSVPILYPRFRLCTSLLGEFITKRSKPAKGNIIYVDGSFDVFHVGHLRLLRKAREMGDYLIVGLYDDQTVRTLKGAPFPFTGLMNRALTVLAMRYTDDVVLGAPYVPNKWFLQNLGITKVVTGKQHDTRMIKRDFQPYRDAKEMGILVEVDSGSDMTTTDIIQRISRRLEQITDNVKRRRQVEDARTNGIHP